MMNRYLAGSMVALALAAPVLTFAQTQDEMAELKAQVAELNRKIAALEAANAQRSQQDETVKKAPETPEAPQTTPGWIDKVTLKGDFRYRFEGIDEEGLDERNRQRIRARLMINADVSEDIEVAMELATGGSNPRSRDVTLDGDGSAKDISLRQAYVNWKPTDLLALTAGKMPQPWARNPVEYFYDSDYMPEGLAVGFGGSSPFYGKGYWLQVDERGSDDDTSAWGGEIGFNGEMFYASLGYQDFVNAKGFNPCFQGNCNGNTVDANGNLVFDYDITRVRGGVRLAGFDFFGQWARNSDAEEDTAYAFGGVYGKVRDAGSWSVAALYQETEKDALYGGMVDATFAAGRTANDGVSIKGTYAITKNWIGSFIWFDNSIDKLGNERDYNRYQLDMLFKF